MAVKAPPEDARRIVSLALDAAFYRTVYADVAAAARDPLSHYLEAGWREGRDPAPWFSARRYLEAYPEIAKARLDPFLHYLRDGRREGRDVFPSEHAAGYFRPQLRSGRAPAWSLEAMIAQPAVEPEAERPRTPVTPADRALAEPAFDAEHYQALNPDVAETGADPLAHFLEYGWREGRDPSAAFSVRDYLDLYPDIAAAEINPFLHYLKAGRAEGRKPRHELGFRYDILANLTPVEDRVARAAQASAAFRAQPQAALAKALTASRSGLRDLHLSFSHDDYSANVGGVQLCLQREAAAFAECGSDHLHLYPAAPWPVLRAGEPAPLGVVWNGAPVGVFRARTIASALSAALRRPRPGARSYAIHNLLGHDVDETLAVIAALGPARGFFWLHDFASLCAGFHLMRDDVADCGAPPPESPACGVCVYGPWRTRHLEAHARLFQALRLTVVAPAQPTLDFWKAHSPFPTAGEIVHPHARLTAHGRAPVEAGAPFRLAFAGMPAAHKGWPVFRELVRRFGRDPRYAFLHLGGQPERGLPVTFREVTVTSEGPAAMRQALAAAGADAALVWPLCRETFSFTAHEAVAAGAAVITRPDSGNVAAFVKRGRHGLVLPDEPMLYAAFESGEVLALARARRKPRLYDLAFSAMTADLVGAEAAA